MKKTNYLVCDNCGNDTWYIVGSDPQGEAPFCQVQICTKCGFSYEITYNLLSAQTLNPKDLLARVKEIHG